MSEPFRRKSSQLSDIRPHSRSDTSMYRERDEPYNGGVRLPDFSQPIILPPTVEYFPRERQMSEKRPDFFSKKSPTYLILFVLLGLILGVCFILYRAEDVRDEVIADSERGYENLALAVESIRGEKFHEASVQFSNAHQAFTAGSDRLSSWGGPVLRLTRYIPGLSKVASGRASLEAGKHFALAGTSLSSIALNASLSKEAYAQGEKISLLDFLARVKEPLQNTLLELEAGNEQLERVHISDVPKEKQEKFLLVRKSLPVFLRLMKNFDQHQALFDELLGGYGPRKYLFLLQNNQEMRATGGFIGSYALTDVNHGVIRRFFVDGIFNPDGQLRENIIPPKPIQKVSAGWSLHDSNWFPDFPMSAEKAIFFYEKTGGPTVDGVITITPTVMQKLLLVTGPIELPQYGLVVDADNFIPVIQEQVEVNYDKAENQPKKVLADLTALLLERAFSLQDKADLYHIANALVQGLNEKQMLLYMRHKETQALIDEAGWSGRVLPTSKDYLSVIHTNINGYKTDGIIDETIKHTAEIAEDGSIVDTVSITRTHRGGATPYPWWNKVNADYLRVYVPLGAKLLSAKGATWEFPAEPIDYEALDFRVDQDVAREENSIVIDEKSGTRIYEDAGKTVFGAWVYVSPQESVTVEYRYSLPFTIHVDSIREGGADSYASLYQKQSGSLGSKLVSTVILPPDIAPVWQSSENLIPYGRQWKLETELKTDVFVGMVLGVSR